MSMKIYHNPRCSKSRQALAILQDSKVEFEVIEYLTNPPTEQELREIIAKLGIAARDLIRQKEDEFKQLGVKQDVLSHDSAITLMANEPKLMERPIVVTDEKAVIGRPPENVFDLL
ncbi:MAG TPA: arsenate reductase (glutaredoxin) [Planctomycetaceae bacterium]|jgi:arsenate reductase|nr:arsenate reductase (glutaredoxin) [Planctomycetaceae bacterium]|tara:strand:- start:1178 stop:1525 length:348 start_codon:yes stop_codon:yes gene_type:complete